MHAVTFQRHCLLNIKGLAKQNSGHVELEAKEEACDSNQATQVNWKKDMVDKTVPFLPISGLMGDKLLKAEYSEASSTCLGCQVLRLR